MSVDAPVVPTTATTATTRLGHLRAHLAMPLFRNGYSLIASTLSTSALGAVFWTVAARYYPASTIGVDAALISAMTLIANLAHLNLTNALNRFVPSAGPATGRLIRGAYATAGALTLVAAAVFVLGARWWAPSLADVLDSTAGAGVFVVAAVLWVLFQLQDSALTGLGRAPTVLQENLGYAVAKIAVLVGLVAVYPTHGVFASWIVPLLPAVVIINAYVFRRFVPAHVARGSATIEHPRPATVGRFIAGDYGASLVWTGVTSVQPIVVLSLVGAEASAYAYIAWTIGYALYLVSSNMGMSLITEAAREPTHLHPYARSALVRSYTLLVPVVVLIVVAAPFVLRVFGPEYEAEATTLLRLLALSAIPYAVVATFLAVARVQKRPLAVFAANASISVPAVVAMLVLVPRWGIVGIGWAWLSSLAVVAIVVLATELRSIWLPQVNARRLAAAVRPLRSALAMPRRTPPADLPTVVTDADGAWKPVDVSSNRHDVVVATVEAAGSGRQAILRVSTNATGERALERHRRALDSIASLDRLGSWRDVVPAVLATGTDNGRMWTLEERLAGRGGLSRVRAPELPALLTDAAESIRVLHEATATCVVVDDTELDRWVRGPLDQLAGLPRTRLRETTDHAAIERLGDELLDGLAGRTVVEAYTHGDYWLGNLLFDRNRVSGIVDWDQAGVGRPAVLDVAHLLLTARASRRREELGTTVGRFLAGDGWEPWEERLVAVSLAGSELTPRQIVLLTWLHHVSANLTKADRYTRATVWLAGNVDRVLEAV